ncbi:hypothetical protein [Chryseobacterium gwangjuense]|uniref:hypothetical protein n=1 Tax=Chryseobacterium gwangjuense TaxID=1069980 RepID=UPI001E293BC3|nr:hypothetical protein [Chryseobacterium gwangjuense]MCE3076273.1 hypothetical protein [Chryseobacterium gwangjuense]
MKYYFKEDSSRMTEKYFVFSRIGMALISAQRVELITGKLLEYLIEFNNFYSTVTTLEFLEKTAKSKNGKRTLGAIFHLLKLNPNFIIEDELDDYLIKRNMLVHNFLPYLHISTNGKEAVDFCYDFGRQSEKIENFFKGFVYFLSLRTVKDKNFLSPEIKNWEDSFIYFMESLEKEKLEDFK